MTIRNGLTGCNVTSAWWERFLGRLQVLPLRPTGCGAAICSWTLLVCWSRTVASLRLAASRRACCSRGGFFSSVYWCACATSHFEGKRGVVLPAGIGDSVCFDFDNVRPRWRRKVGSSFAWRARSRTNIVESASCGNWFNSSWDCGLSSETEVVEEFNTPSKFLCWRLFWTPAGNWALRPFGSRKEKNISDCPVLSLSSTFCLLARSCSVLVRKHLSIFTFPLWFATGLSKISKKPVTAKLTEPFWTKQPPRVCSNSLGNPKKTSVIM